jgi:hypothetical protein
VRGAAVAAGVVVAGLWVPVLTGWQVGPLPAGAGAALGLSVLAAGVICGLAWLAGRIMLRPRRQGN